MHILTNFPTKMHFPQKRSLKGHWSGSYGQTGQSQSCECVFVCMGGSREGMVSRCGESISAKDYQSNGTVVRELHLRFTIPLTLSSSR